ncbi:MAG TPA: hypothetical protein V6C72_12580, partial [Chroococcales cyanobacterium]
MSRSHFQINDQLSLSPSSFGSAALSRSMWESMGSQPFASQGGSNNNLELPSLSLTNQGAGNSDSSNSGTNQPQNAKDLYKDITGHNMPEDHKAAEKQLKQWLDHATAHQKQMEKQAIQALIKQLQGDHKNVPSWMKNLLNEMDNPSSSDSSPSDSTPNQPQQQPDSQSQPAPSDAPAPAPSSAGAPSGGGGDGGGGGSSGGGGSPSFDSGGGTSSGGSDTSSGASTSLPNIPDAANKDIAAVEGNSLLTQNQQAFVEELAKKTGLDANVLGAQVLSEESGSAAQSREAAGNNDWLNIGYTDSGQRGTSNSVWFGDPKAAADATAAWISGKWDDPGFGTAAPGIQDILKTAGQSPETQMQAIKDSGWASGGYTNLESVYQEILSNDKPHTPVASQAGGDSQPSGNAPAPTDFNQKLVNAIGSYDGPTVGGGYCATAVQEALRDAGMPQLMGSGNGWDMKGPLEQAGFKPISESQAQPGDIIVRSWSPQTQSENGGNNYGDISVVLSNNNGVIMQGNDAHYQFESNNPR